MTKKQPKERIVKQQDGFIQVPTYLFPQEYEYSKEITPEMELEEDSDEE